MTSSIATSHNANFQPNKTAIWLAEGQSSQRDMLLRLQPLKNLYPLTLIASHTQNRPEILGCADIKYREPYDKHKSNNIPLFILEKCKQHAVKVVLTGRNSRDYEMYRQAFEKAGIRLLTGATDIATLDKIDNKFAFMQHCESHHIPVATGWRFDNWAELQQLLEQYGHLSLCVKPVSGIFAQGFWRLDTGRLDKERLNTGRIDTENTTTWDSFEHLYFTENKKIHLDQFIHAYQHSQLVQQKPIPMLLMPYLAGQEYSIDVVCEKGEVLAAVTRYKKGNEQHIGYNTSIMALVTPLIQAFGCDGIVSVQTRADSDGHHQVLEINSRASGGIGYTSHAFAEDTPDLIQTAFLYFAGLIQKPNLATFSKTIIPCTVRPITTSVKIS